MTSGDRLSRVTRHRLSASVYRRSGAVGACLAVILSASLGLWSAPAASAAEGDVEEMRYTGEVTVLRRPVPVHAIDSSRVEMDVAGDTVSVTVEFVAVSVLKWDDETHLCTATMHRVYRGQGRMGKTISVPLTLVDASDELEGPECEGVQVPRIQSQTLDGTFLDDGTFKGNIRSAWTITASKVAGWPSTTEPPVGSSAPPEPPGDAGTASPPDTIPPTMTDDEFSKRVAQAMARAPAKWRGTLMEQGYIGVVIATTGECQVYDYTGQRMRDPVRPAQRARTGEELTWIRLGDTLRTSADGRMRVELCNWDGSPDTEPAVISIAANTTMVFDSMEWGADGAPSSWVSLIRGAIRAFFKGFGRDSGFRVRGGPTICGIRGSDVFVAYDPEREKLAASVLEGHMDVTDSRTGESESLTALRSVVVRDGEIGQVNRFTEEQWSSHMRIHGLENMQGLSPEVRETLFSQAQPSDGIPLLIIVAGLVVAAMIGVAAVIGLGVFLLMRRRAPAGSA